MVAVRIIKLRAVLGATTAVRTATHAIFKEQSASVQNHPKLFYKIYPFLLLQSNIPPDYQPLISRKQDPLLMRLWWYALVEERVLLTTPVVC